MIETDIIIEPSDVKILNGDFFIGNANNQNIKHLLVANPGQFLISPTIGIGIYSYQNYATSDGRKLTAKIREELRKDGYDSVRISGVFDYKTSTSELKITANRVSKPKRVGL